MTVTPPDPDKTARVESDARFTPRYAVPEAQFAPGSIIAGRYRIAGILGSGGMGEVYRADDIKLGQAVALKFLPARLARDPILLARLHDEVRLGRQVSHPNVCRIYDIAEWEGAHFVAMELVDGEDLARLLHRIGRLAHDKAVDIARGVAAGLNAAHAKGILHRDLKPANVMIDSHGDARITDFGLALSATEDQGDDIAGTPAYMAPEQLHGAPATVQSDLYALGLVMYELFTGRRAHAAKTFPDRVRDLTSEITHPSIHIRDLDPGVERIILRCLANDPMQRPRSARDVIEALPGGDPLAAAMAAGETPSPRIVAAAGNEGRLRPAVAWSLLGVIVVALAVHFWAMSAVGIFAIVQPKSPEVLEERAAAIRSELGLPSQRFRAFGWELKVARVAWIARTGQSRERWQRLKNGLPAVLFWTRQEPTPLTRTGTLAAMSMDDPQQNAPGASTVGLDPTGRLVLLRSVPDPAWPARNPDWRPLFAAAGFDVSRFTPAPPRALPPAFADLRAAWSGSHPDDGIPIRVEAASFRGIPVFFEIVAPWDHGPDRDAEVPFESRAFQVATATMVILAVLLGALLASRNLRLRRGDRQGAIRVAVVLFIAQFITAIGFAEHELSVVHETKLLINAVSTALLWAAGFCMVYIALEPFVRRRWPDRLISWARLLSGNWRDPMVGRDILIGAAGGLLHTALAAGSSAIEGLRPALGVTQVLDGAFRPFAWIAFAAGSGIIYGMTLMIALMLLTIVLRRRDLAAVGVFVLLFVVFLFASRDPRMFPAFIAISALAALMVARFGLLATVAFHGVFSLTLFNPLPGAISWYTTAGLVAPAVAVLIALWAFRTALGGQSPWHPALLDE